MIFDLRKYDSHIRRIDPMFRELDDMYIDNHDGTRTKLEYVEFCKNLIIAIVLIIACFLFICRGFQKFAARAYMILAEEESHGGASVDSSADYSHEDAGVSMDWEDEISEDS